MLKNNIDLSIIIIFSKGDYIYSCLETLTQALLNIKSEIILIDNASKGNLGKEIKNKYPEVLVIRRSKNGGFGENNNMGIKKARGKYILFLNDDTLIIDKNIFAEMLSWMDNHPRTAVSGCGLLNSDGVTFQGSGGYFPTLFRVFAWMSFLDDLPVIDRMIKPYHPMHSQSFFNKNEEYFKKSHEQDWITGAFYLTRSKALFDVGCFDENFFLYVEEVELSYRLKTAGWQIWYLPKWKIIHHGQSTSGSEMATIYEMKNLKHFYKKHMPSWQMPFLTFFLKSGCILRMIVFGITKGAGVGRIYAKAYKEI